MLAPLLASLLLGVTVVLPAESSVRGTELALGAVALVQGDDPALVERVRGVRLGYAPAPGYSRLLQAWRLRQEVASQLPGVEVAFAGVEATRVWPQVEVVPAASLDAEARRELLRHLGARDADVRLVRGAQDLEVPATGGAFELRSLLTGAEVKPGSLSVPVRVLVEGAVHRTVWTTWELRVYEQRPVLLRAVAAGETIPADAVDVRRLPASPTGPLAREMVAGATAARDLAAEEPLSHRDLTRPLLVAKGDTLFLQVRKGAVQARVAVSAGEAGAIGDRIPVNTLVGGRALVATVVSRDLVAIDLSR